MFENDRIACCEVELYMRMLQKHTPAILSVTVFILMHYRSSTLTRYVCVFVLIHSQELFQIDAFSMKTLSVLVWTEGLKASKWRGRGLNRRLGY